MTFEEIQEIAGIPIDHSFLKYKKELTDYGYQVGKISMKEQTVRFAKSSLSPGHVQKMIIQMKCGPLFQITLPPVILRPEKRNLSVSHVMKRQPEIFSALWLCWKVKEKRVWGKPYC